MEHEVFVPVPVGRLREALSDPERVARAVPGLQQDAGTPPVAGRLKVRIAGHTITYRGTLRVTARDDGSYAVEGDATEARGTGSAKLTLTLRVVPATEGTTLTFTGTATADGRVTELPPDSVSSTVTRLLDRFAENLGSAGAADEKPEEKTKGEKAEKGKKPAKEKSKEKEKKQGKKQGEPAGAPEGPGTPGTPGAADERGPGEPGGPEAAEGQPAAETEAGAPSEPADEAGAASETADEPGTAPETPETPGEPGEGESPAAQAPSGDEGPSAEDEPPASVFEAEVPPSALDPFGEDDFVAGGEPPAEAAHARRTMIGRSAEEVDHAPPRGRYAPVPAPETTSASATLRWAAPAAALAVASAIIVSRALRKRR